MCPRIQVYQTAAPNVPVEVHAATSAGEDSERPRKISQGQNSLSGSWRKGNGSHSRYVPGRYRGHWGTALHEGLSIVVGPSDSGFYNQRCSCRGRISCQQILQFVEQEAWHQWLLSVYGFHPWTIVSDPCMKVRKQDKIYFGRSLGWLGTTAMCGCFSRDLLRGNEGWETGSKALLIACRHETVLVVWPWVMGNLSVPQFSYV